MNKFQSWNRLPRITSDTVYTLNDYAIPNTSQAPYPLLVYGNGRSYGDVCLNDKGSLLHTRHLDRFISFDRNIGVLRCESGTTLQQILQLIVPYGWFLPCTPGTQYATLGGAVANDVHGKNHHVQGSFGNHIKAFELIRSTGEVLLCRPDHNFEMFQATVGGLGLTGLLSWIEIQLIPISNPWMWVESHRFENLDSFWQLNQEAEKLWPYTVSWIDCLAGGNARGRGILFAGKHAASQTLLPNHKQRSKKIPFDPPIPLINRLSLRSFNALYYRQSIKPHGGLNHYSPYFYPLDTIQNWNRIYGHRGFYQYQCVLPPETAKEGVSLLLDTIAQSGQGSFLAVLKTFGELPSVGMLSFARPGTTLALDFPNRGMKTLELLKRLDAIVSEAGGALYPAKDARMPPSIFQSGFPQWERFSSLIDPAFSSHFWQRVTV